MLKAGIGAVRRRVTPGALADPDVVLFATWISVWGRWFIWLVGVFLIAYRPGFWYPGDEEYLAIPVLLFVANGLVHYRLLTHRLVTWRWLLFLSAVDVALTTFGVGVGGVRELHLPGLLPGSRHSPPWSSRSSGSASPTSSCA